MASLPKSFDFNAQELVKDITVNITKPKSFDIRWRIGTQLIKLGVIIAGMSFEIDKESFGVK